MVDQPKSGKLPAEKSFVSVTPENAHLMVFRKKEGKGFELRTLEIGGNAGEASIQLDMPVASAAETNLLGAKIRDVPSSGNHLKFPLHPWRTNTFETL